MAKEASYPAQCVSPDSIVVELCGQAFVWDNIERLAEVQQYGVNLFAVIKCLSKVLKCEHKLAFCRSNLSCVPNISIFDIYNYLLVFRDYDHATLRSYQQMEGYTMCKDGYVTSIETVPYTNTGM